MRAKETAVWMPGRRQRGRLVLLWALGAFVGVQLTASVLLDYHWPQVRFPKMYNRIACIDALPAPPNVIFLGSSRIGMGIEDAEVTRVARELTGDAEVQCFNSGVPVGDPILCERVLQRLLDRGNRPQFAVIEVCPESVNHHTVWLSVYQPWIMRWDDVPRYLTDITLRGKLLSFTGTRFVPLYVYRDQIRQQLGMAVCDWWHGEATAASDRWHEKAPVIIRASFAPDPHAPVRDEPLATWKQLIAENSRAMEPLSNYVTTTFGLDAVERWVRDYRPGGNAAAALERLLANCRSHSIEPILLTVPLSSNHRRCYSSEVETSFHAHVTALAQKYACRYVDCRDALPDCCFIDHHHASPDGARLFSRKFAVEVLAPIWRDAHAAPALHRVTD